MDETSTPAEPQRVASSGPATDPGGPAAPPPWYPAALRAASLRLLRTLILAALSILLIMSLVRELRSFLTIIFLAMFLSFAVEPAVNWFAERGWRRGVATGLIFVLALGTFVLLVALIVPAIVSGSKQLLSSAPAMLARLQDWLGKLGIDFSTKKLLAELHANIDKVIGSAGKITTGVLGLGASILGQIFKWATIGLFLFYFVAEGPRMRRAICKRLPPARQEQVLFVWEEAISKTGGYFYSRLLLAIINGIGMYVTLRVVHVPFAAPLALFEGVVAEFIPIVGTYIAGAVPVLVALLFKPPNAIAVVGYIVVYQSLENYFLAPRLTAKTMSLHPAIAFAAALIGGALGGVLMAFLSLPAAAVIQAAIQSHGRQYAVVDSALTRDPPPRPPHEPRRERVWKRVEGEFGGAAPPGSSGPGS